MTRFRRRRPTLHDAWMAQEAIRTAKQWEVTRAVRYLRHCWGRFRCSPWRIRVIHEQRLDREWERKINRSWEE